MLVIEQYTICLSMSNHPTDGYLQNNAIILFFTNIKLLIKEVFFPKTALFLGILVPLLVITVLSLPITNPFLIIIISLLFIIELLLLFTEFLFTNFYTIISFYHTDFSKYSISTNN